MIFNRNLIQIEKIIHKREFTFALPVGRLNGNNDDEEKFIYSRAIPLSRESVLLSYIESTHYIISNT